MTLEEKIKEDLNAAIKAGDTNTRDVLRGLVSDLKNEFIKTRTQLEDKDALAVVRRNIKSRKDSIEQFTAGGREDLAGKEKEEISILEKYVPQMMSEQEIETVVRSVISRMEGDAAKNFGLVMKEAMKETEGRADGSLVSQTVKRILIG
jgi:uncharacterized protein YqeY